MLLISQGNGYFSADGKMYPFKTGDLFFVFEGEAFFLSQGKNVEYMYIEFSGTRANDLLRRFGIYTVSRSLEDFQSLLPFWKESLFSANTSTLDIATESVLLYTFSRLHKNVAARNDILQRMVELTEERFREQDFSLSTLAQEMNYNAKYLSHLFNQKIQATYSEYLRSLRLKYAVCLLEQGLDSVKNVAFLSGFGDPLYFSNVFKKMIGVSPKKYIQNFSNTKTSK